MVLYVVIVGRLKAKVVVSKTVQGRSIFQNQNAFQFTRRKFVSLSELKVAPYSF